MREIFVDDGLKVVGDSIVHGRTRKEAAAIVDIEHYLNVKRNNERRIKIQKRKMTQKKIAAGVFLAASIALGAASTYGAMQLGGATKIISEKFSTVTEGYGIREDSVSGYIVNKGSQYISVEQAVNEMISKADAEGLSRAETYIGISNYFNSDTAKKYVGEVKKSEIMAAKENAYHEAKAQSKGVSR